MKTGTLAAAGRTGQSDPLLEPTTTSRLRAALRPWQTRLGLALVGGIVLLAIAGPLIAPHTPHELVAPPFAPPSADALLGTDFLGHDVLSRLLHGGRSILWMAFAATSLGVGVGVALGLVSGYSRSAVDDTLMAGADVVLGFPQIVLVLVFVAVLGPRLWLIVLIVALSHVPRVARLARALTAELAHREFVEAAEAVGVPRRTILAHEILPNLTTPLLVEFGVRLSWSIALLASLSFLGFGVTEPAADWGLMINENRVGLAAQPWALVAPAVAIAVFSVGANLVGEGLSRTLSRVDQDDAA